MSIQQFGALLFLGGMIVVGGAAVALWIRSMVEQIQQRKWGWLALFLALPALVIGAFLVNLR